MRHAVTPPSPRPLIRRLGALLAIITFATMVVAELATPGPASAQGSTFCKPGEVAAFTFGFATLKTALGSTIGDPVECAHPNGANGDVLQKTTTGLSFWRKSTNTPTFTDGYRHWGLTPTGMVTWVGSDIDPPGVTTAQSPARPPTQSAPNLAPQPPSVPSRAAPIALSGRGQTATNAVTPPWPISVATLSHDGRSNFIVKSFKGGRSTLLVNEIGQYRGQRPLVGTDPITFDIDADGAWTIRIEPIAQGGAPPFSGRGDAVGALFAPPSSGAWEISHDGKSNFIASLHCASGSSLIQNEIGPVLGSRMVQFGRGPCFWEVEADGAWILNPR
jgi:hypothetical protein